MTGLSPIAPAAALSPTTSANEVRDWITLLKPRVLTLVEFTGWVGLLVAPGHLHPVLAATVEPVLALTPGSELQRDALRAALREVVDERLSEATLGKVIRNVASSWEQAGHLVGRTFKKRAAVRATPGTVAFGLYLGHAVGFRGALLFTTGWISLLDCTPSSARDLAIEAKRIGLIDLRIAGDVVDLALDRLDRTEGRT